MTRKIKTDSNDTAINLVEIAAISDGSESGTVRVLINEDIGEIVGTDKGSDLDRLYYGIQAMINAISSLAATMVERGEEPDKVIHTLFGDLMDCLSKCMGFQIALKEISREDAEALGVMSDADKNSLLS